MTQRMTNLTASSAGLVWHHCRTSCVWALREESLENLRDIPILFFSGAENVVYTPEATLTSYTVLRGKFGEGGYERLVFEGRGHLDCWMGEGASARGGVFDKVRRRVDAVCTRGRAALPLHPGHGQKQVHGQDAIYADGAARSERSI